MRTIKLLLTLLLVASQSALAFNQKTDTVMTIERSYSIKRISYPHNVIAFPINADKWNETISK